MCGGRCEQREHGKYTTLSGKYPLYPGLPVNCSFRLPSPQQIGSQYIFCSTCNGIQLRIYILYNPLAPSTSRSSVLEIARATSKDGFSHPPSMVHPHSLLGPSSAHPPDNQSCLSRLYYLGFLNVVARRFLDQSLLTWILGWSRVTKGTATATATATAGFLQDHSAGPACSAYCSSYPAPVTVCGWLGFALKSALSSLLMGTRVGVLPPSTWLLAQCRAIKMRARSMLALRLTATVFARMRFRVGRFLQRSPPLQSAQAPTHCLSLS